MTDNASPPKDQNTEIGDLFPVDPREDSLDSSSASLIQSIRESLVIHGEMFARVLKSTARPSLLLAELLEDVGNRYIDLSDLVLQACRAKS